MQKTARYLLALGSVFSPLATSAQTSENEVLAIPDGEPLTLQDERYNANSCPEAVVKKLEEVSNESLDLILIRPEEPSVKAINWEITIGASVWGITRMANLPAYSYGQGYGDGNGFNEQGYEVFCAGVYAFSESVLHNIEDYKAYINSAQHEADLQADRGQKQPAAPAP